MTPLSATTFFQPTKPDIEQAFVEQALGGKVEPWENMDEQTLIEWAERVAVD
jgi:hypothetical protein